jgi:truncated hemoglobin YjbI
VERVILHEYEHAARVLGGTVSYTGRPIPELHRPLRINARQFRRRLALLRQELERAGAPADIIATWIEAQERMQKQITDGTDCGVPHVPGR